jgi:ADP-ribosylglycohydrolase
MNKSPIHSSLLGLAVGDALGVPVEFKPREHLQRNPVMDMMGYGTHHQPAGTWSDDTSLALCLAEALVEGYDLQRIAGYCANWYQHGYWSAHGQVFDIGIATADALLQVSKGKHPLTTGGTSELSNGNGSLMRILPLVFHTRNLELTERWRLTWEVGGITHGHIRSQVACFIFCEFAISLLMGLEKMEAYADMRQRVIPFLTKVVQVPQEELDRFHRILELPRGDFEIQPLISFGEEEMSGSGYVLHTLESSIWCLLTTTSYTEAVLKAVNLGLDTDTTGCVTGGIAGLYYGVEAIPGEWLSVLAKRVEIEDLADRLAKRM